MKRLHIEPEERDTMLNALRAIEKQIATQNELKAKNAKRIEGLGAIIYRGGFNEWFVEREGQPEARMKFVCQEQAFRYAAALIDDPCDTVMPQQEAA